MNITTPISMLDVIRKAATADKPCPWCGEHPPLAIQRAGRYLVGCENEECPVSPQASGKTLAEAWAAWNTRHA